MFDMKQGFESFFFPLITNAKISMYFRRRDSVKGMQPDFDFIFFNYFGATLNNHPSLGAFCYRGAKVKVKIP